jgi:hypothetical protein
MICKSREGLLTPFPGSFTPDKKGHLIEVTVPRVELNAGNYTVGVTCESGSQISSSTTVTIKVKCGGFEDELSWPLRDCNSGWQAFGVDIMSNGGCYITPLNEVTEDLVPRS